MKLLNILVLLVLVGLCCGQYMERLSRRKRESCFPESTGTTPFIKEIFLGRCLELQVETAIPNACPQRPVNCMRLWKLFHDAIAYKDPCAIPLDAYRDFIAAVPHQLPADKSMFWSGTSYIVHEYTEAANDLLTLEDTLMGYMVDGLQWCSSTNPWSTGLNYWECPEFWQEGCEVASTAFYTATSSAIGRQATGVVTVMLDATRTDGAYRNDSFFANYEFPNMDPEKVTRGDIILVNRLGKPVVETCGTGSVAVLERLFKEKGIEWTCTDSDERVFHIQCSKDPTHDDCITPPDVME
ncbi:ADP-ribosyl cyclase/cyclic ADP-ribose hydrolase-like [Patiria miniata]|uniref:ADP-ribosyl cyclase/cyclic ADP-ribose hydrolase n=1 Tax=Patiria miniata TaxID=46514 RepID=A0A913ZF63_PATMI|nr:ADP-ribosyl cyclase/cyclic ADP-ribose hydrolase-like [Patiria miniata]